MGPQLMVSRAERSHLCIKLLGEGMKEAIAPASLTTSSLLMRLTMDGNGIDWTHSCSEPWPVLIPEGCHQARGPGGPGPRLLLLLLQRHFQIHGGTQEQARQGPRHCPHSCIISNSINILSAAKLVMHRDSAANGFDWDPLAAMILEVEARSQG